MLDLGDRIALAELLARYNHAIDHGEGQIWAATFAPDGALYANGDLRAKGTTELAAYVDKMRVAGKPKFRHMTHNLIIDEIATGARMRAYVVAFNIAGGVLDPYVFGEYEDEAVRSGDKWLFQTRRMTVVAGDLGAALR